MEGRADGRADKAVQLLERIRVKAPAETEREIARMNRDVHRRRENISALG